MASIDLRKLWQLGEIDIALNEVRHRASVLGLDKATVATFQTLEKEYADVGGKAKTLSAEQLDLELIQKAHDDKIKRINGEIYGGKVVNPREVENFEKEISHVNKLKEVNDERLLEIMEVLPPLEAEAAKIEAKLKEIRQILAKQKQEALASKAHLEGEFKRLSALRPAAVKEVRADLLTKYEAIRKNHGGIGMVKITKNGRCGSCGTNLASRVIEAAKEDRLTTCEECHRILYYSEGIL